MTTQETLRKDVLDFTPNFQIISLLDNPEGSPVGINFRPHSIKRLSDGEVFTIGDRVTNGTQMVGRITGFSLLNGQVFVEHTWSGVGMNLDSLTKVPTLPSDHQIGDEVCVDFFGITFTGRVIKVHLANKVSYDIQIAMYTNSGKREFFRLYNVEERFVRESSLTDNPYLKPIKSQK